MKTKILSSLLLLSLITACAKDPSIAPQGQSDLWQKRAEDKKRPATEKKIFVGQYSGATFLAEKQVEAIEVLRLALPQSDELKTQYARELLKENKQEDGALTRTVLLKSSTKPLLFKNGSADFAATLDKQWTLSATTTDTGIVSIEGAKLVRPPAKPNPKFPNAVAQNKTSLDQKNSTGAPTYINVFEDDLNVKAVAVTGTDDLLVTVSAKGYMNGNKSGRVVNGENFTLKLTFSVNALALMNDEDVQIKNTVGELIFGSKTAKVNISSPAMTAKMIGLCNTLTGEVTMDSDRTKKKVIFEADKVSVTGTKLSVPVTECGARPTVDLSKFLLLLP